MKKWETKKAKELIESEEKEWKENPIEALDISPSAAFSIKKNLFEMLKYFWQENFSKEITNLNNKSGNYLEIAGGSGWATSWISHTLVSDFGWNKDSQFYISDCSPSAMKKAKQMLEFLKDQGIAPNGQINEFLDFDAHEIPFEDNKFDIIFMSAALHHMIDPQQVLNEIYRVLKVNGIFICIGEPLSPKLLHNIHRNLSGAAQRSDSIGVQEAIFSYSQLKKYFNKSGFKNFKIIPNKLDKYRDSGSNKQKYYKVIKYIPDFIVKRFLISSIVMSAKK